MAVHQPITLELRSWIISQAQGGHSPDSVLQAMLASGWAHDVAVLAMEETLQKHLGLPLPAGNAPAELPTPQLNLNPEAWQAAVDGQRVQVLATLKTPCVAVLGGLLSDVECTQLIAAARPRLKRSLTVETQSGGEEVHADRTSSGMFFDRGESELVRRIEARISRLLNWPVDHGEGLQVLRYGPGAEYKPHYDYFDPAEPGTAKILQRGGQRVATVVMYLGEPQAGGSTVFPDVGLEVAPQRGNAVFFTYPRAHPGSLSLHGGAPVIQGEKWIATKWLREGVFT